MSAVRGTDNKAEVMLRRALHSLGLRYRLHRRDLLGRPDILFPKAKVAVFIDGDFWHARALQERNSAALRLRVRGPRRRWWLEKLTRNLERDRVVTAGLTAEGWRVVRVWESDVVKATSAAALRIARVVRRRQAKRLDGGPAGVVVSSRRAPSGTPRRAQHRARPGARIEDPELRHGRNRRLSR